MLHQRFAILHSVVLGNHPVGLQKPAGLGKARAEPKLITQTISAQSGVPVQWFSVRIAIFSIFGLREISQLPFSLVIGEQPEDYSGPVPNK